MEGKWDDKEIKEYANVLKKMMNSVKKRQNNLLSIIDKLFKPIFKDQSDDTSNKQIIKTHIVNPKLTQKDVDDLVIQTREEILSMIFNCEYYFRKSLKIYDQLIFKKLTDQLKIQKEVLKESLLKNQNS